MIIETKTTFCRANTCDNLRLDGILFEPKEDSSMAVLHIHGMAGNFYENFFLDAMAEEYTKTGYAFLTVNNRGHDYISDIKIIGPTETSKRIGNAFEKFEDCLLDIDCWLEFLQNRGYSKIVLQGHSLGAVKAVYYLHKQQNYDVHALILASPPDMLGLARKEKETFERDLAEAKKLTEAGRGDDFLSHKVWDAYYISAHSYLDIFADGAETDVFPILRRGSFEELRNIKIPIFAFYGSEDSAAVFSPQEDLDIIKNQLCHPKSKSLLIDGASHSYFEHEQYVALEIADWLKSI